MSVTFRIECNNCKTSMRYDDLYYQRNRIMHWTCWDCEYSIQTQCLIAAIIPEEEE